MKELFTIAIIGKPNIGKSTLFNQLSISSKAITYNKIGVTIDRKITDGLLGDMEFNVIDTAGMRRRIKNDKYDIIKNMNFQSELAIISSDLILFMLDKNNLDEDDEFIANHLQKSGKDVILLINKYDHNEGEIHDSKYYKLSFSTPLAISAEHKSGFNLLYDRIRYYYDKFYQKYPEFIHNNKNDKEEIITLSIVGRENVGKSTFLNNLLQEKRVIASDKAGTTKEDIEIEWNFYGKKIKLIDTAGIRRRSKVTDNLDKLSINSSIKAIFYSKIVIIMIDISKEIDYQDKFIIGNAINEGRAILIAFNKIDLIKNKNSIIKNIKLDLIESFPQINNSIFLEISAINSFNLEKLIIKSFTLFSQWKSRIVTSILNEWLLFAYNNHPTILYKGKNIKLKYITQAKTKPPTFIIFTNYPEKIKASYERYLINSLKKYFHLEMTIIRIIFRKSDNPYKKK